MAVTGLRLPRLTARWAAYFDAKGGAKPGASRRLDQLNSWWARKAALEEAALLVFVDLPCLGPGPPGAVKNP